MSSSTPLKGLSESEMIDFFIHLQTKKNPVKLRDNFSWTPGILANIKMHSKFTRSNMG